MLPSQAQDTLGIVIEATARYAPAVEPIRVYPNPAREQLLVAVPEHVAVSRLRVTSALGKVVLDRALDHQSGTFKLSIADWPQGIYVLTLLGEGATLLHQKKVSVLR